MVAEHPRYIVTTESGFADSLAVKCSRKRGVKSEEDLEEQIFSATAQTQFGTVYI